jgi:predicted glycogen debranching enzyme
MSYLSFDKQQLVNLEYSLSRENIRTNRGGSYASSTIIGCNTRKYHGLLVCPLEHLDGQRHVLLSSLDASVIQNGVEFQLGIHKYPGGRFFPRGHIYIIDFVTDPIPKLTYSIGNTVLTHEILLVEEEERILSRYTLEDSQAVVKLKLEPFLAFRNTHKLSKANMDIRKSFTSVSKGISMKLYEQYPDLFMQISKDTHFVSIPNWHYKIEYTQEQARGYEYQEDLFVPGYFEVDIKKGESVIFSAGLSEIEPSVLTELFEKQLSRRVPRDSFDNCLLNSAQQFLVKKGDETELVAGYPWFGKWGRDTFIALPGLTLAIGKINTCKAILDTKAKDLKNGLFINNGSVIPFEYDSADAPLWFCWAVQQYSLYADSLIEVWEQYHHTIEEILTCFKNGTDYHIKMLENGLIYAGQEGYALTWMDSKIKETPVTPRIGCTVEINALWYNAVMFALELAQVANDESFIETWKELPELISESFFHTFWDEENRYLYDYVDGDFKDKSIRPNQIFAISLPYSPLKESKQKSVLDIVEQDLLTPKGLRTLSPEHPDYRGLYEGDPDERDAAYHQGTVWVWLLGHFCEAYFKIYGRSGLSFVRRIYQGFEEEMWVHGIGSVSEIFDGNPPHRPRGAISQAWSVGELLRIKQMIKMHETTSIPNLVTK